MRTSPEGLEKATRRGFFTWGAVVGGLLVAAAWPRRKIGGGAATHPSHETEPYELPEFHYGPRIGEAGYDERVARLFESKGLPLNPTSY